MNSEVEVSIIIPCYNSQKYIFETLKSALNQLNVSKQLIVVNDGSTDGTENVIRESGLMDKIEYFYQPNSGVSAARNNGLIHANGYYCCFLDSDDLLNPYFCTKMLQYVKERNLKIAYSDYEYFLNDECQTKMKLNYPKYEGDVRGKIISEHFIPTPSVIIIRRSIVHSVKFDEEISGPEDWLLWIQLLMRHSLGYFPEKLAMIRVRKGSHGRNKKRMTSELIKVMQKIEIMLQKGSHGIENSDLAKFYLRYAGYLIESRMYREVFKKWILANCYHIHCRNNMKVLVRLVLNFAGLDRRVENVLWRCREK